MTRQRTRRLLVMALSAMLLVWAAGNAPLGAKATSTVHGTITDGSGQGWPLYARIAIAGRAAPVYTDPWTGEYSVTLTTGQSYDLTVTAVVSGYVAKALTITPGAADVTQDITLLADARSCSAPGYAQTYTYTQNFDIDDGGWTSSASSLWQSGTPTRGPGNAHSGSRVWATYLAGAYGNAEGDLISPAIDLSAYVGQSPVLTWWQWLKTNDRYSSGSYARVEVSKDGGTTWTRVYGETRGAVDVAWTKKTVVLGSEYAVPNVRVRFHYRGGYNDDTNPGWYIDDVGFTQIRVSSTPVYSETFESSNGGYAGGGTNSSWAWGVPTSGPNSAHSGTKVWATNLAGNYNEDENSALTSPAIDLTAYSGSWLKLSWWQFLKTDTVGYGTTDEATVGVTQGGSAWTTVFGPTGGSVDMGWTARSAMLDPWYAGGSFQVRFTLAELGIYGDLGYYVDDIEIRVGSIPCEAVVGGLIVGNVTDATTGSGLPTATVTSRSYAADTTSTIATPTDPAQGDGLYILFSSYIGPVGFMAAKTGYGTVSNTFNVAAGEVTRYDFPLSPIGALGVTRVRPSDVPASGGTTITVTGSGFVPDGTTVKVGGVNATGVSVTSPTSLTAVSPAHAAGVVDLAVTTSAGTATLAGAVRYIAPPPPHADFGGTGTSGVLWHHSTSGQLWMWPMSNGTLSSQVYLGGVASGWEVRGLGDFNGDKRADILWRNKNSGLVFVWFMNGTALSSFAYVGTVDTGFDIASTGDCNGDGKADVLWRHQVTGETWVWLMNGEVITSAQKVATVPLDYAIVGSGDVDGDGRSDIVWRHVGNGEVWVWLMDGATSTQQSYLGAVADLGWSIVGVDDVSGDGRADLVWRHATKGEVWVWLMKGVTITQAAWVGTVGDPDYKIVGTGDYNGDGTADLLWRHASTGDVWVWAMHGASAPTANWVLRVADTGYEIRAPR